SRRIGNAGVSPITSSSSRTWMLSLQSSPAWLAGEAQRFQPKRMEGSSSDKDLSQNPPFFATSAGSTFASLVHRYKKTSRGVDWQSRQGYKVCVIMAPCDQLFGSQSVHRGEAISYGLSRAPNAYACISSQGVRGTDSLATTCLRGSEGCHTA